MSTKKNSDLPVISCPDQLMEQDNRNLENTNEPYSTNNAQYHENKKIIKPSPVNNTHLWIHHWGRLRQEDSRFKSYLGNLVRFYLQKKKNVGQ